MTKKLNTESIANELEGASLFFTKSTTPPPHDNSSIERQTSPTPTPPALAEPPTEKVVPEITKKAKPSKTPQPGARDTVIPRHHDTTTPRYHDTTEPQVRGVAVELVRKAVKEFGKEAATHRFTDTEKKQIADLIYTYKNQGIRTSENEITRIAVNFIVEDHRQNGENSVLHRILAALNG
jgi:outer membrane biosynthesis protein TonB